MKVRKKGTYIASTEKEGGAVMFRVDNVTYTLRKGNDIELELTERSEIVYPSKFMTITPKSESEPKDAKKEIKETEKPKVEKKEEVQEKKAEPKVEEAKEAPKKATRGRRKASVKIETEE